MSHHTDTEIEDLRAALDYLWGELSPEQVTDMAAQAPEVLDTCLDNHQKWAHQKADAHGV